MVLGQQKGGQLKGLPLLAAAAVALTLVTGSGCMTGQSAVVRMYQGGSLPLELKAVVENPKGLAIVSVDDQYLNRAREFGKGRVVKRIELLPGKHTIIVVREMPKSAFPQDSYTSLRRYGIQQVELKLAAEAGRVYVLGEDVETGLNYVWTPWIREVGVPQS